MSYTHYFEQINSVPDPIWNKIVALARKIAANPPIDPAKLGGAGSPVERAALVALDTSWGAEIVIEQAKTNSVGEIFCLRRDRPDDPEFEWCRTHKEPYDIVVCAMLIGLNHYAPGYFEISSDGDQEDYYPALDYLYSLMPGETFTLPAGVVDDHQAASGHLIKPYPYLNGPDPLDEPQTERGANHAQPKPR